MNNVEDFGDVGLALEEVTEDFAHQPNDRSENYKSRREIKFLRSYPFTSAFIGVLHTFLTAGIVFGWASLLQVLRSEGLDLTPVQFARVFTLGAVGNYLSNLPFGFLLDHQGPKTCCVVASLFFALGLFLCSLAHQSSLALSIGFGLLGFAGPAIQTPTLHLVKLFEPHGKGGTFMSAQAAAFDGGTAVFALLAFASQGWGFQSAQFFRLFMIIPIFTSVTAILIWPNNTLSDDDPTSPLAIMSKTLSTTALGGPGSPFLTPTRAARPKNKTKAVPPKSSLKDADLLVVLRSPSFYCLAIWVGVHILKLNFVVATINNQLSIRSGSDLASTTRMVNVFGSMLPFGFVIMPLAAYLLETNALLAFQVSNTFGVLYGAVLAFLPTSNIALMLVVFPLVATSRQLVYSTVFQEIGELFGFRNYGVLLGIVNIVVSGISFLQNPMVAWAESVGTYFGTNVVLLAITLPLFVTVKWALGPTPVQSKILPNEKKTYGTISNDNLEENTSKTGMERCRSFI